MGKYLKKFSNDSARVEYEGSENYLEPYVSYVEGDNTVHYNKPKETRVVAVFNVTDTSQPTKIMSSSSSVSPYFVEIEIDGVAQPSVVNSYVFDAIGEHTVKYVLSDGATICDYAFEYCSNLQSIIIPDNVTSIGKQSFWVCNNLTNVTMPNSITTISSSLFYRCTSLSEITIPNSVTSIDDNAFYECTSLTSVVIPDSVTSIDYNAFEYCSGLINVTVEATTPPTLGNYVFNYTNCSIYVPSQSVEAYKAAENWSTYASRIQAIQ